MPPAAEAHPRAGLVHRQRVGMLLCQPDRWGGRWGAENHIKLALLAHLDAFLQPVELKLPRPRFQTEPRELGHVDNLQPHGHDVVKIPLPLLLWPLLGVVIRSDFHEIFPNSRSIPESERL